MCHTKSPRWLIASVNESLWMYSMWYKTSNNHRLANQKYHIIHEYSASQIHQVSHFIKFIFLICAAYSAANGITFQTILPLDTQYNRTPHPTVSPNPIPQYLILSRHSHSQPRAINTTVPYRIPPPRTTVPHTPSALSWAACRGRARTTTASWTRAARRPPDRSSPVRMEYCRDTVEKKLVEL